MILRNFGMLLVASISVFLSVNAGFGNDDTKNWEDIFFESINQVTEQAGLAGLERLRDKPMSTGNLEVRFWAGFGVLGLQHGFILKRMQGQWQGYRINVNPSKKTSGPSNISVDTKSLSPEVSWKRIWQRLRRYDILNLPDESSLPKPEFIVIDGICYVVEYQLKDQYRTYHYCNPTSTSTREENRKISKIAMTLKQELGLTIFSLPSRVPDIIDDGEIILIKKEHSYGAVQFLDQELIWNSGGPKIYHGKFKWRYRTDGKTDLSDTNHVREGMVETDEATKMIKFGPFKLSWNAEDTGKGQVSYLNSDTEQIKQQSIAITEQKTFKNLNASPEKWDYRRNYIHYEPLTK